jgi:Cft2 family RNA processing exonuclease
MEIELLGGFGEKGRTSVGIRSGGSRIVLDAGIKVGAACGEYYPVIGAVDDIDALFISHAHEDHIGALNWLLSRGYRGRILMTAETRAEAPATLPAMRIPST